MAVAAAAAEAAAATVAVAAAATVAGGEGGTADGGALGGVDRRLKARRVIINESLVMRKWPASFISLVKMSEGLITPGMWKTTTWSSRMCSLTATSLMSRYFMLLLTLNLHHLTQAWLSLWIGVGVL